MIDNQKIQDLQMQYGRDVNLLIDKSNAQARSSLNKFKEFFQDENIDQSTKSFFFQNILFQNFIQTFSYPSDSVRELSYDVLQIFLNQQKEQTQLKSELASTLLQHILDRVNNVPYQEDVEEIRIKIIKVLNTFMKVQTQVFKKELSNVIQSIEALLKDKYHEIKKSISQFLIKLCEVAPNQIGLNCSKIFTELNKNLRHQHKKVRLITIEALENLFVLPNVAQNLKITLNQMLKLQNDKYPEVRQQILECVYKCLMNFDLENLATYEDDLILCLITGLNEENEQQKNNVIKYLEEFGQRRKHLFDEYKKQIIFQSQQQYELFKQILKPF